MQHDIMYMYIHTFLYPVAGQWYSHVKFHNCGATILIFIINQALARAYQTHKAGKGAAIRDSEK